MNHRRLDMMIDLETAGPAPDGAIIAIGWCIFDRDASAMFGKEEYGVLDCGRICVDTATCLDIGMGYDADTLRWWMQQEPPVQALWTAKDRVSLSAALDTLNNRYYDSCMLGAEPGFVWAYPSTFDLSIIMRAYDLTGVKPAFHRKHLMCARSVMKAMGYRREDERIPGVTKLLANDERELFIGEKHLPEQDAIRQAIQLQHCLAQYRSILPHGGS